VIWSGSTLFKGNWPAANAYTPPRVTRDQIKNYLAEGKGAFPHAVWETVKNDAGKEEEKRAEAKAIAALATAIDKKPRLDRSPVAMRALTELIRSELDKPDYHAKSGLLGFRETRHSPAHIDAFIKNELEGLLTAFADVGQNLLEAAGCPVPDEPSPAAESGDE